MISEIVIHLVRMFKMYFYVESSVFLLNKIFNGLFQNILFVLFGTTEICFII